MTIVKLDNGRTVFSFNSFLDSNEWYDASEKYRESVEQQHWCTKKIWEKEYIPNWWLESPIVLAIKERGKRNKEIGQKPSPWCHPLEKGIDRIIQLGDNFESAINVQVFHWEKSKPPIIKCEVGKVLEAEFHNIEMPSVLGSSWTSPKGTKGTVLVNYTSEEQEMTVHLRYDTGNQIEITDSQGRKQTFTTEQNNFRARIKPYEAWVVNNE